MHKINSLSGAISCTGFISLFVFVPLREGGKLINNRALYLICYPKPQLWEIEPSVEVALLGFDLKLILSPATQNG